MTTTTMIAKRHTQQSDQENNNEELYPPQFFLQIINLGSILEEVSPSIRHWPSLEQFVVLYTPSLPDQR